MSSFGTYTNILGVAIALVAILYAYFKWAYQYWARKNVPYLEPTFPFGSSNILHQKENGDVKMKRFYDKIKSKRWKHAGLFAFTPVYTVVDLDYIKNIMTRDFEYFIDLGLYYIEEDDPLSAHLFNLRGVKWKNLRTRLTFTSGRMKMMFQTLVDCIPNLLEEINSLSKKNQEIDIKEVLGCFTTDNIGSCAFGLECNTFKDDTSLFRKYGRKAFSPSTFLIIKIIVAINFLRFARALKLQITRQDVTEFFMKLVKDTVKYRKKNNFTRKDCIRILIDLKNNKLLEDESNGHDGNTLSFEEIAAQSFVFFIAEFETSSTTMTFVLYELARNPDLQQKVRDEINSVLAKHDGKMTYESIYEMKYMDQVINKTLRMYPPVTILDKKCVKAPFPKS